MQITNILLKEKRACSDAVEEFDNQFPNGIDLVVLLGMMVKKKYRLDWANWLIVRCMTYKQYVSYAVFSAEQVIDIYEKKYPEEKRLREAINAAKKCIDNPTKENKAGAAGAAGAGAAAAADAAYAAADAADAAYAAAYAAYAANAAAYAAYAAYAAAYAAYAANDAAYAAAYAAAADARTKMRIKILKYGIKLLEDISNAT